MDLITPAEFGQAHQVHAAWTDWVTPPRTFALIALLFGTCLVLLIPPFESADEPYHLLRAYQISEGNFVDRQRDVRGYAGGYLPKSLFNIWLPFADIGFHPSVKASVSQIRQAMRIQLNSEQRIFITFPNTAHYCPTCYLPQCAGILLGRILGLPPLAMLYLGREANLLAWVALGYGALKASPALAHPLLILLLMPMSFWLSATLSADPSTNGLAALFTALICKFSAAKAGPINRRRILALLLVSVPLCISKLAYAPLLSLLLLIPARNFGSRKQWLAKLSLIVAINLAAWGAWVSASSGLDTQIAIGRHVSARQQLNGIEKHPRGIPRLVLNTFERRGWSYVQSYVALIGWYDLYLPNAFVIGYLIFLFAGCWAADESPDLPRPRLAALVVTPAIILSIALIMLLSYLYWSLVGQDYIDGFHGRYLIALTPAVLVVLCSIFRQIPERYRLVPTPHLINLSLMILLTASTIYFLVMVWGRYYGWIKGISPLYQ